VIAVSAVSAAVLLLVVFGAGWTARWNWLSLILVLLNCILWTLPLVSQLVARRLDPFHPLIYAALFFGIPMVVFRGAVLALGRDSYVLTATGDFHHYLNLALTWAAVGWLSVLAGFYLPLAARLGSRMKLLPRFMSQQVPQTSSIAAVLVIGLLINLLLLWEGAYGSALSEFPGDLTFVSVFRALGQWFLMGWFLVVFASARVERPGGWLALLLCAGALALGQALLSGSRALFFTFMIVAAAAAFYARSPRTSFRWAMTCFAAAVAGLFAGMLLISQYRILRMAEFGTEPISVQETAGLMANALEDNSRLVIREQISLAVDRLIERLNSLDFLGVTLARAESLQASERVAGIDNNIVKDVVLSVIPRPLWPGKPVTGDFGLWFSRLYLDSPYLTWAGPSVFGDLYRNFGFTGIPAGMLLVGIYLRVIYEALIRRGTGGPMAPLLYFFLLHALNWEAAYSSFVTGGSRAAFTFVLLASSAWAADRLAAGKSAAR
jgi:hypothetical protein